LIELFFILYTVLAAGILNLNLQVLAVYSHNPETRHTVNNNPDFP